MPYGLIALNRVSSHKNHQTSSAACDRGSVLLAALAVNAVILLLTVSYFPFFQTVVRAPAFAYRHDQARQVAEAGISDALWEFNAGGADWLDWTSCGSGCYEKLAQTLQAGDGSSTPLGQYTVRVASASSSNPVVTATGYVPTQAQPQATRQVMVTLAVSRGTPFTYGAYALISGNSEGTIKATGSPRIDSYDSSVGPYNPATVTSGESLLGTNGDPMGMGAPSLALSDMTRVLGNTAMPSNGTVQIKNSAGAVIQTCPAGSVCSPVITGAAVGGAAKTSTVVSVPTSLQGTNLPAGSSNLATASLVLPGAYDQEFICDGGRTVTFSDGTESFPAEYRFRNIDIRNCTVVLGRHTQLYLTRLTDLPWYNFAAMTIANAGNLQVTGKTDIYFHGSLDFRQKSPTLTAIDARPADVGAYGVLANQWGPLVMIGQAGTSPTFMGVINNPNGTEYISGNSQFFGAIESALVRFEDQGQLHYDVALKQGRARLGETAPAGQARILTWFEN